MYQHSSALFANVNISVSSVLKVIAEYFCIVCNMKNIKNAHRQPIVKFQLNIQFSSPNLCHGNYWGKLYFCTFYHTEYCVCLRVNGQIHFQ